MESTGITCTRVVFNGSIPQLEHLRPHHSVPRLFFCAGPPYGSTWAM